MVASTGIGKMTLTRGGVETAIPVRASGLDAVVELETKDLDFGDPKSAKFIDSFVLDIDRVLPYGYAYVGGRDRLSDAVTWSPAIALTAGADQIFLPFGMEYRFFRLRLLDTVPIDVWKLTGVEFYGSAPEGEKE